MGDGKGLGHIQTKAVSPHRLTNGFSIVGYLFFCVFSLELLYPAFRVNNLLFAREKWMTF